MSVKPFQEHDRPYSFKIDFSFEKGGKLERKFYWIGLIAKEKKWIDETSEESGGENANGAVTVLMH